MMFTKCLQFVCSPYLKYMPKCVHERLRSHSMFRRSGRSSGGQASTQLGSTRGSLRGGVPQYCRTQRRSSSFSAAQRCGSIDCRRSVQRVVPPLSSASNAVVLSGYPRSGGGCRFGSGSIFTGLPAAQHVSRKLAVLDLDVCNHPEPLPQFIEEAPDRAGCSRRNHAGRFSGRRWVRGSSGYGARSVLPKYVELDTSNSDPDGSARDGAALRPWAAFRVNHSTDDAHESQRSQSLHRECAKKAESGLAQR